MRLEKLINKTGKERKKKRKNNLTHSQNEHELEEILSRKITHELRRDLVGNTVEKVKELDSLLKS